MTKFKNLQKLFFLLVMGFSLSVVCACGDDKKDEPVVNPSEKEPLGIIGTWRYQFSTGYIYLYFDKSGFGWEHEYDEADGGWYEKDQFVYVYDEAAKRIAIKWEDGDSEVIIISALSEDKMVLEDYGDSGFDFYDRVSDGEYKTGEEDKKDETFESLGIIGTWRYQFSSGYVYMYFGKDGYGWEHEYDEDDGGWYDKDRFTYTYDDTTKKMVIKECDGDIETIFVTVLSETKLVLEGYGDDEIDSYDRVSDGEYKTGDGENEDNFSNPTGIINGHAYVDLGLSVMWATCNVGADFPEGYGDYFAWGETMTKSDYDWDTYKWRRETDGRVSKYCTDSDEGTLDNRTTLTPSDDVATVKWGSKWRMPTAEEMEELIENCIWTWTELYGEDGMKITGPNGNSIFLPDAGNRDGAEPYYYSGSFGDYWSATLDKDGSSSCACRLYFNDSDDGEYAILYSRSRGYGLTVRPVTDK